MWFIEHVGPDDDKFMRRIHLLRTPWGRLMLHTFWQADPDPDPHDHPWDFWTFPFTPYWEVVRDVNGQHQINSVWAWRWHHRSAEHQHMVKGPIVGTWRHGNELGTPIHTLVWARPKRRGWGFWVLPQGEKKNVNRVFVPWRVYRGIAG